MPPSRPRRVPASATPRSLRLRDSRRCRRRCQDGCLVQPQHHRQAGLARAIVGAPFLRVHAGAQDAGPRVLRHLAQVVLESLQEALPDVALGIFPSERAERVHDRNVDVVVGARGPTGRPGPYLGGSGVVTAGLGSGGSGWKSQVICAEPASGSSPETKNHSAPRPPTMYPSGPSRCVSFQLNECAGNDALPLSRSVKPVRLADRAPRRFQPGQRRAWVSNCGRLRWWPGPRM